jgi:hypothetical protein
LSREFSGRFSIAWANGRREFLSITNRPILIDRIRFYPSQGETASELQMSASEVHACVKRAAARRQLHEPELLNRPNLAAVEELLVHGWQYAFPAERGALTRGVPTLYAAAPLRGIIAAGTEPVLVWPSASGTVRGIAFAPLYKTAPSDAGFYELLILADALRSGRSRERQLAAQALSERLQASRPWTPTGSL